MKKENALAFSFVPYIAYEFEAFGVEDYLADYCKKEFNSIPSNDVICGFMAVELACEAAKKANSTVKVTAAKAEEKAAVKEAVGAKAVKAEEKAAKTPVAKPEKKADKKETEAAKLSTGTEETGETA
mgnify:CR=1 FL=1